MCNPSTTPNQHPHCTSTNRQTCPCMSWAGLCFTCGDSDSHLLRGSLGPPESISRMASRSVQPFLQGSHDRQTNRPTDRQTMLLRPQQWATTSWCSERLTLRNMNAEHLTSSVPPTTSTTSMRLERINSTYSCVRDRP